MTQQQSTPSASRAAAASEWREIVAALTRRQLFERTAGIGTALLMGTELAGQAYGAEAPTRAIATTKGKTVIPVLPKRVVTVDWYSLPILLDLGYTPVGAPSDLEDSLLPSYKHTYTSVTKVGAVDSPNLELIASLRPDLIIGLDRFNSSVYSKLDRIAPTALFRWQTSGDWAALADSVADAVGRTARERTLKASYQQRAAAIRRAHSALLARTRWDIATGGTYGGKAVAYLWHANSDAGQVLAAAGIRFAKASAPSVPGGVSELSFEELGRLSDADAIVVEGAAGGGVGPYSKPLVTQSTFKRLPAAGAAHVFPLAQIFPTSYRQAIALLDEVEAVLKRLEKQS